MNQSENNLEVILLSDPSEPLVHPFCNKRIVFTGAFSSMTRSEAAKKVSALGGVLQGAVTKETDFVILGNKRHGISSKHTKAKQLISIGFDIQFLLESDFLWVLSIPQETLPATIFEDY